MHIKQTLLNWWQIVNTLKKIEINLHKWTQNFITQRKYVYTSHNELLSFMKASILGCFYFLKMNKSYQQKTVVKL